METIQIRYERFECRKVRQQVIVNSLVLPGGKDEAGGTAGQSVAFDCDQKHQCGLPTDFGQGSSLDWSFCVCPDLNPR
jgi:hypothetical protein